MSIAYVPNRIALLILLILFLSSLGCAQIPYTQSWLGNTFLCTTTSPYPDFCGGDIALCVNPNGLIFTNCTWDEASFPVRQFDSNGECSIFTNGNLNNNQGAGFAVASNSDYLYFANANGNYPGTGTEFGIVQCNINNINDQLDFLVVNSTSGSLANLMGLAANANYVYASDPTNSRILAYDAATMATATNWTIPTCPNCNALAVDGSGNVWVLQIGSGVTPQVSCYNSSGSLQSSVITFASGDSPTAIAYDSLNNRLLVTDNGSDTNIKCYNLPLASGSPTTVSTTFGAVGGIYSATNGHLQGQVAPLCFNNPLLGIGVDDEGNFTVLYGDPSNLVMEQYNSSGTLQWVNGSLSDQNSTCPDPSSNTDVYTADQHFIMNYANPPGQGAQWATAGYPLGQGAQWTNTGYTIDQTKYGSSDLRIYNGSGHSVVRLGGQKFLLATDTVYALEFYRFNPATDGETAIPCAFIATNDITSWTPPNNPDYPTNNPSNPRWIWTDTNGNGVMDTGEFQQPPTNVPGSSTSVFSVDSNGNVWEAAGGIIYEYLFQGLNSVGAPQYSFASGDFKSWPIPAPLTSASHLYYEPSTDTLFVCGESAEHPWLGNFGTVCGSGMVLVRYNNWSTTQTVAWQTTLVANTYGFSVAGQFIFTESIQPATVIYAFDQTTGLFAGTLCTAANIFTGEIDVCTGLTAFVQPNGNYSIFQEDDGYYKTNMYTISASAHLPPITAITSPGDRTPYALGTSIPITASAIATTGSTISSVGLYMDGIYMGAMTAGSGNSYSYTLVNPPLGVHVLTCMATDSQGATTTSLGSNVQVTNNGLLAWWRCDEDTGTTTADASGIGNTLSLSGNTWTTGKFGSALSFTGSGQGTGEARGFIGGLAPRTAITVAVWAESPTATWNGGTFISQGYNYWLSPIAGGTGIQFELQDWANNTWPIVSYTPAAGFNIETWHHYAATFNGTTMILYIDGAQVATQACSMAVMPDNVDGLVVGASLDGTLDSLRVYNCALTATQINALATASTDLGAAPTTSLTSPPSNFNYVSSSTVPLAATATPGDSSSTISDVAFYANGTLLDTSSSSPYSYTWSSPAVGSYELTSWANSSNGLDVISAPIPITVWPNVQAPWTSTSSIGSVTGSAGESANGATFEVTGSGAGFGGTADGCQFLYQQVTGNCTIIAQQTSYGNSTNINSSSGVMMRASLTAGATEVYEGYDGRGYACSLGSYRTTTNGSATTDLQNPNNGFPPSPSPWVEIVRNGSNFSRYVSADGINWSQDGSTVSISMPNTIYVGLAATEWDSSGNCVTTTFSNVSINQCALPAFSPAPGLYTSAQAVTISTTTSGATINYTTNGTTPSETVGTVYSSPVNIAATTTLQAIAYVPGTIENSITSGVYTIQCVTPTFSPAAGTYAGTQSVTISTTTGGATIRYTTDGSTPSETNGTVYSTPLNISAYTILKAIAYESGMSDSMVASGVYTISSSIPTANLALWLRSDTGVTYNGSNEVSTWADQSGNGRNATQTVTANEPTLVTSVVNGHPVIRFTTAGDSFMNLADCNILDQYFTAYFVYGKTAASALSLLTETPNNTGEIGLAARSDTSLNLSHYGTGDTTATIPAFTSETFYDDEFWKASTGEDIYRDGTSLVSSTTTTTGNGEETGLQIGYWCGTGVYMNADVAEVIVYNTALTTTQRQAVESYLSARYALTTPQCGTPTFSPVAGTYGSAQSVTISTNYSGASINYTTNGTTPSPTVGTVYSSPVNISANTTLQAIAYQTGFATSSVASGVYTIQCAAPAFSPVAGYYTSATVTISTSTSGASIRYTTNGTTPSSTVGTVYSTPVALGQSCTLQAIAYMTGLANSSVTSGAYHIFLGNPTVGGTNTAITANEIRGTRFQAGSAMTLNHIALSIGTSVSGNIQCAIYSDSSGVPGTFLIGTNALNNPGTGWAVFALTASQPLTSGSYYWLVFWSAADYSVNNTTSGGSSWYRSLTYGSWPSSAGSGTTETRTWSIFGY